MRILSPFAPHITEEIWNFLGNSKFQAPNSKTNSIHTTDWPKFDPKKVIDEEVTIAIQVNGKVRAEILISTDLDENSVKEKALSHDKIKPYLEGKEIKKFIYIKNKLVSIVV